MAGSLQSLRGQLLLDGGNLAGSFFHRTVVLICQHDADGAFGLVLNRPAGSTLGELIAADFGNAVGSQPVFLGGPVQPSAFSYLHSQRNMPDPNVMPDVSLGHSLDDFLELSEKADPSRQLRVFAGYSGWSSGQLESELEREAWLTHPASLELVFDTPAELLWRRILRQKGWQQRLLAETPEDLSWN
jgi:putative transcriptional regulator